MWITSSYFRELHKNISYSKLLLVWTWEHNIMRFSFGPAFWVMFTRGYLMWTMSSFFGELHKNISYLKFCWFELKTTKSNVVFIGSCILRNVYHGVSVNYEFIIWELWENISLCFLLWGGGKRQMENNPLQKGQEQKQQQEGTNISYHHFLIWTIVVGLNFAISGRGAIRPWEVHLLSWGSSTNFWTIQHLCRLYFSMSTVLLKNLTDFLYCA